MSTSETCLPRQENLALKRKLQESQVLPANHRIDQDRCWHALCPIKHPSLPHTAISSPSHRPRQSRLRGPSLQNWRRRCYTFLLPTHPFPSNWFYALCPPTPLPHDLLASASSHLAAHLSLHHSVCTRYSSCGSVAPGTTTIWRRCVESWLEKMHCRVRFDAVE